MEHAGISFQFPLWDTGNFDNAAWLKRYNFQFPLWDTILLMFSKIELDRYLSIPFMGYIKVKIKQHFVTTSTFNSLYGIL